MSRVAFIAYEPPAWGQSLRSGPAIAWDRVKRFLNDCTDTAPDRPFSPRLTIYEPVDQNESHWFDSAVKRAEALFGSGQRRVWLQGVHADFSVKSRSYCIEWQLLPEQVEAARSYIIENKSRPRKRVFPPELTLHYSFRLIDPSSGEVLPGQSAELRNHAVQATSDLTVGLSQSSWATLFARFPFSEPNDDFLAYLACMAPLSPVPLLANKFRHWIPTKKTSHLGYTRRKLNADLLSNSVRIRHIESCSI